MAKSNKKEIKQLAVREKAQVRNHKASFTLNDKELNALNVYCKKYKVPNKSKFMREIVMRVVMEKFMDDYPTLFGKEDLDKLIV